MKRGAVDQFSGERRRRMENQINIFDCMENDPMENPCCVIVDGKCQDVSWGELFDSRVFDTLQCVTYVSSGSFYEKAAGKFDTVKIIIGIEKGEVQRAFGESIRAKLNCDGEKIFSKLPDNAKQKIINKKLELRYSVTGTIIHSKFYLLSDTKTGKNRVIVGSANLTESAFSNNISQYEDVMVFDDSPYFEIYQKRFDVIYKKTVNYVSEETVKRYCEGTIISVADFTAEEKTEKLIETLKRENIVPLINEAVLQQAQESQDVEERELSEVRTSYEVIAAVSKKSKKTESYILKPPQELLKIKPKLIDILFRGSKKEQELARFTLMFNDADKKQYLVYPSKDGESSSRPIEIFDRRSTDEEIKVSMEILTKFIVAYRDFVSSPDADNMNLSHVFETILYAFTSTYIFKLRQETSSSRKADIPIMLIIGGRAASGKSSLLAFIDALLSGRKLTREDHYIQYEDVAGKKTLEDLFNSENTYPLLVDEVAPSFFNSRSTGKGEALIKYLSNTLVGKHPVMICTTNTDTFNIPAQVARRIYYVQVDACFDDNMRGQASTYYEDLLAEIGRAHV